MGERVAGLCEPRPERYSRVSWAVCWRFRVVCEIQGCETAMPMLARWAKPGALVRHLRRIGGQTSEDRAYAGMGQIRP